ncbi:MAG: hypothetical protein HRF52_14595 [Ignavibacterium sp.]|jgi:hypothetical protein|uniref:hypothetical protein n=1 Tax=Ignavibacterium sp. TaxID=2651167 RepID=UPI003298D297
MNKELITAFVDNEIKDASLKDEIKHLIDTDEEFRYEYQVQSLVKRIAKEKYKRTTAPDHLRIRILNQIAPEQVKARPQKEATSFWAGLFSKPAFSFATAIIIVISVILILFNRTPQQPPVISEDKLTPDNMFYQAENNFEAIIQGKLAPQLVANNPEQIKNFFESSGVKYSTLVPTFSEWSLLGAVVSEDKGEKFAHHVYAGKKGEIVYVFQVDESYLKSHEIISLDESLLQYLEQGNCYVKTEKDKVLLFKKIDHNICAVVSNAPIQDVQNNFCNI